jgi:hypothetical protein
MDMAIDDKLGKTLDQYERSVVAAPGNLVIEAALNAVPFVGSSIAALLSGKAQERVRQRVADVFTAMKEKLDSVEEESVRKDYFSSEEFQTLLALVIEQLQTTHDKDKLRLLARVLVNSGLREFATEERKEVFVRALRDLTPSHISILAKLLPQTTPQVYPQARKNPADQLLVQYLVALGFVEEINETQRVLDNAAQRARTMSADAALSALRNVVSAMAQKKYRLTEVGQDFLVFLDVMNVPLKRDRIRPKVSIVSVWPDAFTVQMLPREFSFPI